MTLVVRSDPTLAEVDFLEQRLYEFNVQATGIADGVSLAIFVRDDSDRIVAGLAGHTWGGCCDVKQVWVAEDLRGRGIGRSLIEAAEEEARRRGCTQMLLSTHSFQAPEFYRKRGFEIVATFADYPRGYSHLVLRKRLEPLVG